MAKMLVSILLLLCLSQFCNSAVSTKRRRQAANTTQLDALIVRDIDKEARKEILFMISDRLNDAIRSQAAKIDQCERKINESITLCSDCNKDLCTTSDTPFLPEVVYNKLSSELHVPITYAGEVVKDIAEWTVGAKDFMDERWGQFTKNIGVNFIEVSKALAEGGQNLFGSAVTLFKTVGDKFETAGQKIIDSVGNEIGGIVDDIKAIIGDPFSNFDSTMKNIGKTITEGATLVKDKVKSAVTTVWDNTFGRLFRRKRDSVITSVRMKRCTSSCPVCETLEGPEKSTDKIAEAVCGAGTTKQKAHAVAEITFLRDLYNRTKQAEVITAIEYDTSSALPDSGHEVYTESFFTWDGIRMQLIAGVLNISSTIETGESIAHQYFATEIANIQTNPPA